LSNTDFSSSIETASSCTIMTTLPSRESVIAFSESVQLCC
jgi:hypothetical protein